MRHRGPSYGLAFSIVSSMVLATFKLMGIIDWPWWAVISPIWFPIILIVVGLALVGTFMTFEYEDLERRMKEK